MTEQISIEAYIEQKRSAATKNGVVKISSDIETRWGERVVGGGLIQLGARGAEAYLERYGKSIAAPKVIGLALKAEQAQQPEMAQVFWRKAYELEQGSPVAA